MGRTLKEIDAEIKALEKERDEIRYQELAKKYSSILDLFEESDLTVAKIKKIFITAITDEPGTVMISATGDGKEKSIVKESPKQKRGAKQTATKTTRAKKTFKEKACTSCGKMFIPRSGRQTICDECKAKSNNASQNTGTLSLS